MTNIKYVGAKKDGERAFREQTGIEWFPGDVKVIPAAIAQLLLKHPDVWAIDDSSDTGDTVGAPLSTALSQASTILTGGSGLGEPTTPPALPEWAKLGIDLGLTDAQLEQIAKAGGPDTEIGAAAWLEVVGKPFHTEPPPPQFVIAMPDGMPRVLDGMEKDALHDLAKQLAVAVHPNAGAANVTAKLVAALPFKK